MYSFAGFCFHIRGLLFQLCHKPNGFLVVEVISRNRVQLDPQKIKALMDMPPPNNKRELQAFLGIINYLGKFFPSTVAVCEPLQKLTSSRAAWTWNASYQTLFVKAKWLIKADVCMKFYDESKPHYDASREGLGAAPWQT